MILRTFLAPPAPDVELGTVSFKSKMDEVIKNFCQYWPIYDLPFELVSDEQTDDDDGKKDAVDGTDESPMQLQADTAAGLVENTPYSNNNGECRPL